MAVVLLREMKLNVEEELGKRALSMHLLSFFFHLASISNRWVYTGAALR